MGVREYVSGEEIVECQDGVGRLRRLSRSGSGCLVCTHSRLVYSASDCGLIDIPFDSITSVEYSSNSCSRREWVFGLTFVYTATMFFLTSWNLWVSTPYVPYIPILFGAGVVLLLVGVALLVYGHYNRHSELIVNTTNETYEFVSQDNPGVYRFNQYISLSADG